MPITIRTAFQPSVPLTVSDVEYVGLERRGLVYAIDTGQSIALPTNGALMTVNIRTTMDPSTVITVSDVEFADLFRQHLIYSIESGGPIDHPDFTPGQYAELAAGYARTSTARALPSSFRKWRQAMARVRNQVSDARVLCVGDSTVAGLGASIAPIAYGAFPYRLAQLINSRLTAARGLGIPPTDLSSVADTRWSAGSGWTQTASGFAGHAAYEGAANAAGALTYTDNTNANRYDIYTVKQAGGGVLSITATGGAAVTVDTSTASGNAGDVVKTTVSASSTSTNNVVTFTWSSGGAVRVIGVDSWISNVQRVRVGNAGVASSRVTDHWQSAASRAAHKAYAPDLTIIDLGLNDMENSQPVAQFMAAMVTVITDARASGDVLVMVPPPPRSLAGDSKLGLYSQYRSALNALDVPVADTGYRWISGDEATTDGLTLGSTTPTDYLHPNMAGYQDIAQMLVTALVDV